MYEKIKQYFCDEKNDFKSEEQMAKDITERVEKENKSNWTIEKILKENVDLKNRIKPLEDKINMLKAKCFRLRQTRMAYQSLADKRRDYANHISTTLHKKNLKIKELNQRVAKLELDRILKLDRDKIIEVLRKNLEKGFKTTISGSSENGNYSSFTTYFPKQLFEFIEQIANEIINK